MSDKDLIITHFGCFSPPTNSHLALMASARNYMTSLGFNVIKVIMIPAHGGYSSMKPGLIDANHRVKMCKFLAEECDFLEIDTIEADKDHWSRTIDTLLYFRSKFPNTKIMLACGADTIDVFETKWREPDVIRILLEFGLIVFPREEKTEDLEDRCKYLKGRMMNVYQIPKNPLRDISSTLVREMLEREERIDGLVLPSVMKYIYENHLYNT